MVAAVVTTEAACEAKSAVVDAFWTFRAVVAFSFSFPETPELEALRGDDAALVPLAPRRAVLAAFSRWRSCASDACARAFVSLALDATEAFSKTFAAAQAVNAVCAFATQETP